MVATDVDQEICSSRPILPGEVAWAQRPEDPRRRDRRRHTWRARRTAFADDGYEDDLARFIDPDPPL